MKKALITGITGQDGSYLAELLLEKGYEVYGIIRRCSTSNVYNIRDYADKIKLYRGDILDLNSLMGIVNTIQPDEIYNLAAQSDAGLSFELPHYTINATGIGALNVFEACRNAIKGKVKIYQASSSEMFGKVVETPQNELTPFNPANPYAAAKVFAHNMAHIYRDSYKMFISCGILFNHESPRRGTDFVTQKVCALAASKRDVTLGNLSGERDWGYAPDYVKAMWLMLQQDKPDDFVIATGEKHTVEDLCKEAYGYMGLDWTKYVSTSNTLIRPTETGPLVGDYSKAKKILGWEPTVKFKDLIGIMINARLDRERSKN